MQQTVQPAAELGPHELLAGACAQHDANAVAHAFLKQGPAELAMLVGQAEERKSDGG
ncbi:hypothetical protein D9M69_727420 [compost metagenome]